jgi:cyclohexanone monooxygenase
MSDVHIREQARSGLTDNLDAVVVGAGFAGMYMLYRLRELDLRVRVVESGGDVGGTWYWNRYPGARVDVPSLSYSYSFSPELQQEWNWPELYSAQADLLRYANHVADRFDLRRDIQFDTTVVGAEFDETSTEWVLSTDKGARFSTRYLITAVGCLSATNVPEIPGLDTFEGEWCHTGRWPEAGVDLVGKRVGVIGTGSSGIQAVPPIAAAASHLYVFQRTPNYSLPTHNEPMDPDFEQNWKGRYEEQRELDRGSPGGIYFSRPARSALEVDAEERVKSFEEGWAQGAFGMMQTFNDLRTNLAANETAAEFVRQKIRQIVRNPEVADLLCPTGYPIGTKRLCMDSHYFEAFNRENVTLVDVKAKPILEVTQTGVCTSDRSYELDVIVFATGYDAMTGPLLRMNITGRSGLTLKEKWASGPRTYLGLAVAGFPNMFTITGPGSPSVLTSMVMAIEQHVDFISDTIAHTRQMGLRQIEPESAAEDAWVEHVTELADKTLYKYADSWYGGANIDGKPRVFMPYVGGFDAYRAKCQQVAEQGYEGFILTAGN